MFERINIDFVIDFYIYIYIYLRWEIIRYRNYLVVYKERLN